MKRFRVILVLLALFFAGPLHLRPGGNFTNRDQSSFRPSLFDDTGTWLDSTE